MGKPEKQLMYRTAIAKASADDVLIRGYSLRCLIGNLSIAGMCYLLVKGVMPSESEGKMLDAILVAGAEHGVRPPSIQAARQIASGGVQFQACVAGGILALGDSHGGAIEDAMGIFVEAMAKSKSDDDVDTVALQILTEAKERKQRLPGYGHPVHGEDPRTTRLFDLAREYGIYGKCCRLAESIAKQTQPVLGRNLPLNVDGGVAAILSEMGFDPRIGKGIFAASRVFGIIAHVFEEKVREKPMAHLPAYDLIEYDGKELISVNK
jgi:citrate synthase